MDSIRNEFRERQLLNAYNRLDNDIFIPTFHLKIYRENLDK